MRRLRTRSICFVAMALAFVLLRYSASLRADSPICSPDGWGYGYATIYGDGTCAGVSDQSCWGACSTCFDTEDYGQVKFCDDNSDETGQWYDALCACFYGG
jgi:hypothetical protein